MRGSARRSGTERMLDVARAMTPPRFLRRYREQEAFRRRIRRALPMVVLFLVAFSLLASDTGLVAVGIRAVKIRRLETDVAALEHRSSFLHDEHARRQDDRETLERLARERCGLAYPGEKVYRIIEVDDATARRISREQRLHAKQAPAEIQEDDPRASR